MRRKKIKSNILQETIISLIIITQNDGGLISKVLTELNEILKKEFPNYEILVIDNNSTDNTLKQIHKLYKQIPNIKIIRLSKASSPDIAYTAGLDNCIGDYAILFDFRLVPVKTLSIFIQKLFEKYDIIIARSKDFLVSRFTFSYLFLTLVEKLSTHEFNYQPISLLALNRKTINSITKIRRKSRNFSYISNLIGFRKLTVLVTFKQNNLPRPYQHNFFSLVFNVFDTLISNSFKPIRLLAALGMLISLGFLFYAFFVAIMAQFFDTYYAPRGWVSLASVMGVMFFLLFSLLTLMAEYILRILHETRNEPLYFIADEMDQSVISIDKDKLNLN